MKNKAFVFGSIFLIVLIYGCAGFGTKSPEQLSKEYTSKAQAYDCLLYTSPSPRDGLLSRMPSSA